MSNAHELASAHWNANPLYWTQDARYREYPWLPEAAQFERHKGHKVLEMGCGTGCDLLQFARHGAIATGVDITDTHLNLAQQRCGDAVELVKSDIRKLPFADGTFDFVYSHGVLHHSDEPEKVVGELLRVLKSGGGELQRACVFQVE